MANAIITWHDKLYYDILSSLNIIIRMDASQYIKMLLLKEGMTITKLAELMSIRLGKRLSRTGLSNKLHANTLRFNELLAICEILHYELEFKKG